MLETETGGRLVYVGETVVGVSWCMLETESRASWCMLERQSRASETVYTKVMGSGVCRGLRLVETLTQIGSKCNSDWVQMVTHIGSKCNSLP